MTCHDLLPEKVCVYDTTTAR